MTAAVQQIPTDRITPNPSQHRRHFEESALRELSESIASRGVLQNLVVRPHPEERGHYEIIAGERRYRAAKLAGLKQLPCRIIKANEAEAYRLSMVENVQRADISPLEEADGYAVLRDRYNMTAQEIASSVGKSAQYVNHKLQMTRLCKAVRRLIDEKMLNALSGYFISRLEEAEQQTRVATAAVQRQLSPQEVNRMVNILLGGNEPVVQGLLLEVESLTEAEQERRNRFQKTLDSVTAMLWAAWDSDLQKIQSKVIRNAVESDLEKVRNLRKWLGQVETALDSELQRRNLQEAA